MKSRQTKKRRKYLDPGTIVIIKQAVLGVIVLSCVALLLTAVWYIARAESFTITNISVSGGKTIDDSVIKERVEKELEGAYYKLIPKRFSFWYPEEEIVKSVSEIERIDNVSVSKLSGTDIAVTFVEYLPDALWCDIDTDEVCYFLDETGYSFGKAPTLSGESLVRYYKLGEKPDRNTSPFTQEDYEATREFGDLLREGNWFVTQVEIDAVRDVFYTLARGSELKATLTDNPIKPFTYLKTLRQSKEFEHLDSGNFQYIDLRFGSKVFVNEELKVVEMATSSEEVSEDTVIPAVD
jgi:cell division septal protein FtsQ